MCRFFVLSLTFGLPTFAPGADSESKKAAVENQKVAIATALDKGGAKGLALVETPHLLVYADRTAAKTKPVADLAEKAYAVACKALFVEKPDALFDGKLAVLLFETRRPFGGVALALGGTRPEAADAIVVRTHRGVPFVAVSVVAGEKPSESDLASSVAAGAASAVLNKAVYASPGLLDVPEWARAGFGRIVALRAENNASKLAAYRSKAKALAGGRTRGAVKLADVWSGSKGKDTDVFEASVVDFLTSAPEPKRFLHIVHGFQISEQNQTRAIADILTVLDFPADKLDAEWKAFVTRAR
jgi:hypothetical protein